MGKVIELKTGEKMVVDDEDFDWLSKIKWYIHKQKNTSYAQCVLWENGKNKNYVAHRLILNCKTGDKKVIDHKDGNGLNNQKENLRFCTYSQNSKNRKPYGASKYLGVSLINPKKKVLSKKTGKVKVYEVNLKRKWRAQIKVDGVYIKLGMFSDEGSAAIAYNDAAIKYHGEFANVNIIKEL